MGGISRITGLIFLGIASQALAAAPPQPSLEVIRGEISSIERDLLNSRETKLTAAVQLKKMRRLLALQAKEIELSRKKVKELGDSMSELSKQKQALHENIAKQKVALRSKLIELNRLTQSDALDASWLANLDAENQRTYFLAKTLKKDLAQVQRLRLDVMAAQTLELRILEEKNKLDYYVNELHTQMAMVSANEQVQKEIIRTNRSHRLEALERMRSLKESERQVEKLMAAPKPHAIAKTQRPAPVPKLSAAKKPELREMLATGSVEPTLAALKGKLPFPLDGAVLSTFGKFYNPKTNLLTFQKGITLSASPSTEVKAVSAGKVVFAGPLQNYGLIAIVEHPGQYYTLYGQMGSVTVMQGTVIKQGDVLGKTAGEPLYFEIRDKNVAINPLQWLSNGSITLSKQ